MTVNTQQPTVVSTKSPARLRLDFLDGVRGLAALYVVFYHVGTGSGLPRLMGWATYWMQYGHYAVDVFIVLSGYCLMLPVAKSADGILRGGFRDYLWRRARRIIPPYYAALVFSLIFILLTQVKKSLLHEPPDHGLALFGAGNVISHLLLFHNVSPEWSQTINPPMWSVATEWQIYFVFPAVLLPLWRRAGSLAPVLVSFALTIPLYYVLPQHGTSAFPWFVGLFALGMAGASLAFSNRPGERRADAAAPWGPLAVATIALFWVLHIIDASITSTVWVIDLLVGVGTLFLLAFCARAAVHGRVRHPVLWLLQSRPAVKLGAFSYSLYLTHLPVWWALQPIVRALHLPPTAELIVRLFVAIPIILGVAYLFHIAFERRFMPGHLQAAKS